MSIKYVVLFLLLLSACQSLNKEIFDESELLGPSSWPKVLNPVSDSLASLAGVETLLASMTLEEKVGQILQAEIQSITVEEIKTYSIGSVPNGGGSTPNRNEHARPEDWLALADAFYQASMDTSDGGVAIPIIWGTDAVHGHNNIRGATIFPHNIGLGAANNPHLISKIAQATAREVKATGIDWVFSPTLAVAQNDRWGRTYESYSEEPAIIMAYAKAMITGLQGEPGSKTFLGNNHVVATAKHFLADGGTLAGNDQGDAKIGERELMGIHNAPYVSAIEAGVQTIMASFSSWNGKKIHGSHYLLSDILKGPMAFNGLVVGDWNGHGQLPACTNDSCAAAFNAGIDLLMVTSDWKSMYHNTLAQVQGGEISIKRLNDAVRRILLVKWRAGLFLAKPSLRRETKENNVVGNTQHRLLARQAVRESLVLLKNKQRLLPLNPQQTLLVAGEGADNIAQQIGGWSVSWQGRGHANSAFPGATSIFAGIEKVVEKSGGKAILFSGDIYSNKGKKPDVAIVVFGEKPYAEGRGDINTLEFEPNNKKSLALLLSLKSAGIPTVSIFLSGRPLWVNPELNASDAFVAAWLPGTQGGGIADLIIGNSKGSPRYDFNGQLSFSWPKTPTQERLNRHHSGYDPLFAYGYGLNYQSSQQGPLLLPEVVAGIASSERTDIDLYVERPLEPWQVFINNHERSQLLSGAYASLPDGSVIIETSDKTTQEDALRFTWNGANTSGLSIEGADAMDLSAYQQSNALVSFDIKIDQAIKGSLALKIKCGLQCTRRISLNEKIQTLTAKGWKNIRLKLSCFSQDANIFKQLDVPFSLEALGQGSLMLANIRFVLSAEPTHGC
ncbi:MAG: exo 1,3/1,4-beta-D-glucan glucohydrolase [Spongiibacteraceae bacterium]|nr:exo 1,3/1,4-beta-D-glucan glucohydrolase [Spongiibacteraceae bacterium]